MTAAKDRSDCSSRGLAPWQAEPYRLWSLLDMIDITRLSLMPPGFILGQAIVKLELVAMGASIPESNYGHVGEGIAMLLNYAEATGLQSIGPKVDRIREAIARGNQSAAWLRQSLIDLVERAEDEMKSQRFLVVQSSEVAYYEQPKPIWGNEIHVAFGSLDIAEDIEEAGKCLALNRGTASVFHLMRMMEAVVKSLGTPLKIPNPATNWGVFLGQMDTAIGKMVRNDPVCKKWSENKLLLFNVKESVRNDTMHPKATYTVEQAKEVFNAMRAYLPNLAKLVVLPIPWRDQ